MKKSTVLKFIVAFLVIFFIFLFNAFCAKNIFTILASSGFYFNKNVNLVSKSISLDVATFHVALGFSGDISIDGNRSFEPSFSSKQIKPNEAVPLNITLKPSSKLITLTLRISVNGQEFTKQLSSKLSSPFDNSLDLGSVSIPLGGIGNPQITINATYQYNEQQSKLSSYHRRACESRCFSISF